MRILLHRATIIHPPSPYHLLVQDILIVDGFIAAISDGITDEADIHIDKAGLLVSIGWVDGFAHAFDPGYEYKETLSSIANAAAAGGFTQVLVLPNTNPVIHNKTTVEYITQQSKTLPVNIHPYGAISKGTEGKELAEMYDMFQSGAIAFTDGIKPVQSAGLLVKALQYVKAFNGVLVQMPVDASLSSNGLMHEGIISTQLGLPGLPAIAEEIMISRDIELATYTNSRLHFSGISTAKSVELIKAAKQKGVQITCSVTPYHLYFTDESLQTYDANLKVNPPLRSSEDRKALQTALVEGYIDCVASHHIPQDIDNKNCEFEYAKAGMIGLQTTYNVLQTALPEMTDEQLVNVLSLNARTLFGLPMPAIEVGAQAELTLFCREGSATLTTTNNKSKSANSPFINETLNGTVVGIIHKSVFIPS